MRARKARRKFERGKKARGIGASGARDVERGAVVGRGAHEGKAQRHVHRAVEGERLRGYQNLIVIHAERDIVVFARAGVKERIGGIRPARRDAFGAEPPDRGYDDFLFFIPDAAAFARMRIEFRKRRSAREEFRTAL